MPAITIDISDAVWQFLNKKGEPAEVAKNIIESAWELDTTHLCINCSYYHFSQCNLGLKPDVRYNSCSKYFRKGLL